MIRFFCHKSIIAGVVLFAFFLSANGFLFGSHAVGEMLLETNRGAGSQDPAYPCSLSHHHGHSPHSHSDSECCGAHGHHSHEFRSVQPLTVARPSSSSRPRFFEGTVHIAEVYLEWFIPPQNPVTRISRNQIQVNPAANLSNFAPDSPWV